MARIARQPRVSERHDVRAISVASGDRLLLAVVHTSGTASFLAPLSLRTVKTVKGVYGKHERFLFTRSGAVAGEGVSAVFVSTHGLYLYHGLCGRIVHAVGEEYKDPVLDTALRLWRRQKMFWAHSFTGVSRVEMERGALYAIAVET